MNLPSTEEAERVWNYNHTQAVFYAFFHFSELKCFPHSPTPCIPSSISLHLVGPTCLSLICLPCTIPHFSLSLWITTCILHPLPHLSLLLLSFPLALFSIYPPLRYTFITRSVPFLLHHIPTSLASTFPFFSSGKSNSIPHLPLSSLQYCGKGKKINRFKQTNQSSGNSLFVREIKITGWWMNMLTL